MRTRLLCGLIAFAVSATAWPQTYPSKPIRLVIGFGAGGVTDVINRAVAVELSTRLGQPVVVENRPGGNTLVAANAVRNAPPDGYALYGGSGATFASVFVVNGPLLPEIMTPVANFAIGETFMYASSALNVKSLSEFVAYAKANPHKVRFAALSPQFNMYMAVLAKRAGVEYDPKDDGVPYSTVDQVLRSLLAGDTQIAFSALAGFEPLVRDGRLRIISSFGTARFPAMPNVPTAVEQNVQFLARYTLGVWGPLGVPKDIVAKLAGATADALKEPALGERMRSAGMIPGPMTPSEMIAEYDSLLKLHTEAAALIGFKPQ